MEPSFEKLLVTLAKAEVRFVVVGGLAVTLNGYVRLTEDVDFVVEPSEENLRKLIATLGAFGEGYGGSLNVSDFTDEPGAIRVIEASINSQMDIFTIVGGFYFDDLIDGSETGRVGGEQFRYASKSQLIKIKSSSHRDKDKIDISALKQLIEDPDAFG